MFRNMHATVGQSQGRVMLSARKRAGSSATLGLDGPSRSPVPRPLSPRFGLSLTEVLISMGILTVGLLGVASVFPVASYYMQKGDIADRGSAIAQAAFNEALARGLLNPGTWYVMTPHSPTTNANQSDEPNYRYPVDGRDAPSPAPNGTFTRPFQDAYAMALNNPAANPLDGSDPGVSAADAAKQFGGGFVIDPIGVDTFAAANVTFGQPSRNFIASAFPSSAYRWFSAAPPNPAITPYASWSAWRYQQYWPLRRVTFREPSTGWQLSEASADRLFRATDDLALDMPARQDRPSQQRMELVDIDGDGEADDPLIREARGDYSWLITVMPTSSAAQVALGRNPAGHKYEVSVVVFYKRVLPVALPTNNTSEPPKVAASERMATAKIVSTGLNGGEVLLQRHNNDLSTGATGVPESPFQELKTGQWIALCGPHPNSTDMQPLFVTRWYRVLAIEGKDTKLDADGNPTTDTSQPDRRLVSLRGPEWPWQPAASLTSNDLSNNLCAAIIPGAVAVHAKTIQLEGGSIWSGGSGGASGLSFGAGDSLPVGDNLFK